MKNRILGIIPARGGSKSIPKKNTRLLLGKPLIAYTIEVALKSKFVDRVIVSSDDKDTVEIAKKYGAEVPFIRPRELALDTTPMVLVLQHAVGFLEERENTNLDYVLLLQPTAPLRLVEDIDNALKKLMETGADSVISVSQVDNVHPILMKRIENDLILPYCIEEKEGTRRQDYSPPAYMRNGAIYVVKRDILMNNDSVWGKISRPYIMPPERSVCIDSELDFKLVEILLQERG
ncbi:CMP-N,N'-diacetyllegionaminic acid synthase [subsurface metagenome]